MKCKKVTDEIVLVALCRAHTILPFWPQGQDTKLPFTATSSKYSSRGKFPENWFSTKIEKACAFFLR
jgi:hypothetical protein